jgi:hypothetical protein
MSGTAILPAMSMGSPLSADLWGRLTLMLYGMFGGVAGILIDRLTDNCYLLGKSSVYETIPI